MSDQDAFGIGFWIGNFLYLGILVLIFRFAGRWGWIGLIVRIICAVLVIFRLLAILALYHPPGS